LSTQIDVNFFRGDDLGTWAAFAVTFLVRPFGAVLFGYIADKKGRKLSVLLSLSGIIIGTVGQGCVPTYYCCGYAHCISVFDWKAPEF
jgi:MHS family alpha-ketoglutarate permease-like MFS transporter